LPKTGKFGLIRQKNTHKIRYVERVELGVSLVRLKLNTISTLPQFKIWIVSHMGPFAAKLPTHFHRLALPMFPTVLHVR
jgi:hypothetical protein